MKDHNSGAKEQAEEGGAGEAAANVVPFPRSWYGSVDELVPIDPGPAAGPEHTSSLTDAGAFWGGEATRPDDVRDAGPDRAAQEPVSLESEWRDDVAQASPGRHAAANARSYAAGATPSGLSYLAEEHRKAGRRGLPAAAFALVLVAIAAALLAVSTLSGRSTPHRPRTADQKPALTVTQTVPQTTTVVQTVTTPRNPTAGKTRTVHHRLAKRAGDPPADAVSVKQTTTPATSVVQSPAPSVPSPARSVPSDSSSSGTQTAPARSGGGAPAVGNSKPRCAPSVTNGGACSL